MALDGIGRGTDRLHEISMNVLQSHMVYLQTDDSPLKLKQRQKLEGTGFFFLVNKHYTKIPFFIGFIKEYLYLVPHESKFIFPETAHILRRSAATMNGFSGYRACSAFTAIALYASNLLAQPWRKEYWTLRTYSGFYKHEIEANLIGAELMFELMGYKHTGLGVLTLEAPLDPDIVSSVSRDAIVAFVECQILKQIWEGVSQTFSVPWLDVLLFREGHVGSPEQAIRALNHRFWERLQQSRHKVDYHYAQPAIIDTIPSTTMPYHIDYPYDEKIPYFYPIETSLGSQYKNPYGCLPKNNRHCPPFAVDLPPSCDVTPQYGGMVVNSNPFGGYEKLKHRKNTQKSVDEVDYSRRAYAGDEYGKIKDKNPMKTSTSLDSAASGSWAYVYNSLESLKYNKDVGEREDVLKNKKDNKVRSTRNLMTEYGEQYGRKTREKNGELTKNKSAGDLNSMDSGSEPRQSVQEKIKKINNASQPKKIIDLVKNIAIRPKDDGEWDCSSCTYLNKLGKDICDMCGKSRTKGNEDRPLASGGKQCPKCTLVNEKHADVCEACETGLKHSPTYI